MLQLVTQACFIQVVFFEGGYSDYEEDRFQRTGVRDPTKIKYKPMPTFA